MRNLVLQVDIPTQKTAKTIHGYYPALYETSKRLFVNYARSVEADYLCINSLKFGLHPTYERFRVFEERFDVYENILYVDCDVIPKVGSPNIFKAYGNKGFCAFPEGGVAFNNCEETKVFTGDKRLEACISYRDRRYSPEERRYLSTTWIENNYFNAGVFIIDNDTRRTVRGLGIEKYLKEFVLFDQSALNKMVFENSLRFTPLSYRFNGLFHFFPEDSVRAKLIYLCDFIHFVGPTKSLFEYLQGAMLWKKRNAEEQDVLRMIEQWKVSSEPDPFERHVAEVQDLRLT